MNKIYFMKKFFYKRDTITIKPIKKFKVDFDKVKTIDDIKLILEAIHIGFNINFVENYEKIDELKELLVEIEY